MRDLWRGACLPLLTGPSTRRESSSPLCGCIRLSGTEDTGGSAVRFRVWRTQSLASGRQLVGCQIRRRMNLSLDRVQHRHDQLPLLLLHGRGPRSVTSEAWPDLPRPHAAVQPQTINGLQVFKAATAEARQYPRGAGHRRSGEGVGSPPPKSSGFTPSSPCIGPATR